LNKNEKILNLLRMSDSFFPMGSFTMSQGMEQIINENLLPKEKVAKIIDTYLDKVWKSFDMGIFYQAMEAAGKKDTELLKKIDEICYCSKLTEENRAATVKMGKSLMNATEFDGGSIGKKYKDLIKTSTVYGTYPVALALASIHFKYKDLGALSLIYVNLMEVTASLVRMGVIDYIEAQIILSHVVKSIQVKPVKLCDLHQSFPLVDIASMRHELSNSRMFMS